VVLVLAFDLILKFYQKNEKRIMSNYLHRSI